LYSANGITAQPNWTVNSGNYNYSMTITGVISIDFVESRDDNDIVGAFIDGECRGYCQPVYLSSIDRYIVYLMIYNNDVTGNINLKVYDASTDTEIDIPTSIEFSINGIIGSTVAPYIWSNPTLSSEAEILTFGVPGQVGETTYNNTEISFEMPYGTDLTNLTAGYSTSPYAQLKVNNIIQISDVTINNFNTPVEYLVISADETTMQSYTVIVNIANAIPSDIYLSSNSTPETKHAGDIVGFFTTEDANNNDTHTYSFVGGNGDTDNGEFIILDNELILNTELDFETKSLYNIRIQTEDNNGGVFEKEFKIHVIDKAEIFTFTISEQVGETQFEDTSISLFMPYGYDISNLVANYTTSNDAVVKVNNVVQASGMSANDFSIPLKYWVSSTDATTEQTYTVSVTYANAIPTDIYLSSDSITETKHAGDIVGFLTTEDENGDDMYTYNFISGEGGHDNESFMISGNELIINTDINFEAQSAYAVRIKTVDSDGGEFEKQLVIQVVDIKESVSNVVNVFSPNNDGINDYWELENSQTFSNCEFFIFNSIGKIIFESIGYNNNWDGTYKGKQLPVGTYYYIIKCPNCIDCQYSGSISLIR